MTPLIAALPTSITCGPKITCSPVIAIVAVVMGIVIFVGSIYVLLSAVFGRRMGYLVLAVAFFGWMILFSSIWAFGFWSQGLATPTNLGPRGAEPHWQPLGAGLAVASPRFPVVDRYPDAPWHEPDHGEAASVDGVKAAVQTFLSAQANLAIANGGTGIGTVSEAAAGTTGSAAGGAAAPQAGTVPEGPTLPTDFTVEDVRFATEGKVSLAVATAVYNNGGPKVIVPMYHDTGSVPRYSWMFLAGAIIGFAVHLPFLDRAERRRKAVLTGGTRPPWLGPA